MTLLKAGPIGVDFITSVLCIGYERHSCALFHMMKTELTLLEIKKIIRNLKIKCKEGFR